MFVCVCVLVSPPPPPTVQAIRETEDSFLHTARTSSSALESMLLKDLQGLSGQVDALSGSIDSWNEVNSARMCSSGDSVAKLVQHLSARLSELSTSVKGLVTTNVKVLQRQQKVMEAFAAAEMDAMRETSEDMIHRLAKVMSRHAKSHAQRVEEAMAGVLSSNAQLTADTSKIHSITSNMTSDVADSVVKWSQTTTEDLVTLGKDAEKEAAKTSDQIHGIKGSLRVMKSSMTGKLRELYSATVHHHARVDSEAASTAALSKAELENVPHVLKTLTEEELAAQEAAELAAREAEAAKESAAERQHRERRSTASGATVRQVHMGICPTSRMRKDAAGAAPGMKLQQVGWEGGGGGCRRVNVKGVSSSCLFVWVRVWVCVCVCLCASLLFCSHPATTSCAPAASKGRRSCCRRGLLPTAVRSGA